MLGKYKIIINNFIFLTTEEILCLSKKKLKKKQSTKICCQCFPVRGTIPNNTNALELKNLWGLHRLPSCVYGTILFKSFIWCRKSEFNRAYIPFFGCRLYDNFKLKTFQEIRVCIWNLMFFPNLSDNLFISIFENVTQYEIFMQYLKNISM